MHFAVDFFYNILIDLCKKSASNSKTQLNPSGESNGSQRSQDCSQLGQQSILLYMYIERNIIGFFFTKNEGRIKD